MVGEAFEFQSDAAQHVAANGHLRACETFHRLAESRRMTDRRVAGHGLDRVDRSLGRTANQGSFRPAVLIAERHLQVEYVFPVALEAKVPRLNDAGMNRADGHLVDLLSPDAVVVGNSNRRSFARAPAPGIVARAIAGMKAHRLEPGMPLGADTVLFADFPLKQVNLRALRRERGEAVGLER